LSHYRIIILLGVSGVTRSRNVYQKLAPNTPCLKKQSCQKLSKLVEIWRSSGENNFDCFLRHGVERSSIRCKFLVKFLECVSPLLVNNAIGKRQVSCTRGCQWDLLVQWFKWCWRPVPWQCIAAADSIRTDSRTFTFSIKFFNRVSIKHSISARQRQGGALGIVFFARPGRQTDRETEGKLGIIIFRLYTHQT